MQKQCIGIFSGSFNPIHVGHLILANFLCEFTHLSEVWFVVSPHNPLKKTGELLEDGMRLEMAQLALEGFNRLKVSDVEFHLPRPSYTVDTLTKLTEQYPDKTFSLIIGGDNWKLLPRWKEYMKLISRYDILIYPRLGEEVEIPAELSRTVRLVKAPIVEISSTFIRENIRNGKNMRAFLPPKVYEYIEGKGLYKSEK